MNKVVLNKNCRDLRIVVTNFRKVVKANLDSIEMLLAGIESNVNQDPGDGPIEVPIAEVEKT